MGMSRLTRTAKNLASAAALPRTRFLPCSEVVGMCAADTLLPSPLNVYEIQTVFNISVRRMGCMSMVRRIFEWWRNRRTRHKEAAILAAERLQGRNYKWRDDVPMYVRIQFIRNNVSRGEFEHALAHSCQQHETQLGFYFQHGDWKKVRMVMRKMRTCGACGFERIVGGHNA